MNAVIVARAQIDRGKAAVIELTGQSRIPSHQGSRTVLMPLGLKDLLAFDPAELTDRTIYRANPVRLRQRTNTVLERTCEKGIEGLVGSRVGIGCLGHVHLVALDKATNDCCRQSAGLGLRQFSHQRGQRLLGQEILGKYGESIRHNGILLSKL